MDKATLGFRMYKIWQIWKRFAGTFRRAQTLKLGRVISLILIAVSQNTVDEGMYANV